MKNTTVENKSQLAKLLATENIEVQENAVQTILLMSKTEY